MTSVTFASGYGTYNYKTALGRAEWLSRDPLPNAEISQGANLYWYVQNNPVNGVDPAGLIGIWVLTATIVIGLTVYGIYKYVENAMYASDKFDSNKEKREKLYDLLDDPLSVNVDNFQSLYESSQTDINQGLQNAASAATSPSGTTASGPPGSFNTAGNSAASAIGSAANTAAGASGPSPQR